MSGKKNMDAFFREKLRGQDVDPPEEIWEQIDKRLHGKQSSRRLLPFWLAVGGAAAILLLMITLRTEQPFGDQDPFQEAPILTDRPDQEDSRRVKSAMEEKDSSNTRSGKTGRSSWQKPTRNPSREALVQREEVQEKLRSKVIAIDQPLAPSVLPYTGTFTSEEIKLLSELVASPRLPDAVTGKEPAKASEEEKKFSISPVVAVLYYDNIGKGHALDPGLKENSSNGAFTTSYGVSVGYRLSENLRLKTGVHHVRLESVTRQVRSADAFNASAIEADPVFTMSAPQGKGTLQQSLEYLETPFELEYGLVRGELTVNLQGGASAYFLQDNGVVLDSRGYTTFLGAANNLSKTSFSLNLGFGLNYSFSQHLRFNLGPSLKYHLNTFRSETGVKPFHIGLSTGFSLGF